MFFVLFFNKSFLCTQSYWMQIIFKQVYLTHRWTQTGTTMLGLSGPGSNVSEGVLYTPQISRCSLVLYPRYPHFFWKCLTPLQGINSAYWPIDGTLLSRPESNGNEGVLYLSQISRCSLVLYPGHPLFLRNKFSILLDPADRIYLFIYLFLCVWRRWFLWWWIVWFGFFV